MIQFVIQIFLITGSLFSFVVQAEDQEIQVTDHISIIYSDDSESGVGNYATNKGKYVANHCVKWLWPDKNKDAIFKNVCRTPISGTFCTEWKMGGWSCTHPYGAGNIDPGGVYYVSMFNQTGDNPTGNTKWAVCWQNNKTCNDKLESIAQKLNQIREKTGKGPDPEILLNQ